MFLEFPRTFTPKECKKNTTNFIYKETQYVHLTILSKPKILHTIPDGVKSEPHLP